jgi:hypothetical protein
MRRTALLSSIFVAVISFGLHANAAHPTEHIPLVRPRTLNCGPAEFHNYLTQLRRLNDSIRLVEVRIGMLQERLYDLYRFPRSPFMVSIQNAELQLIEAQQSLRHLRRQRALMPSHFRKSLAGE